MKKAGGANHLLGLRIIDITSQCKQQSKRWH